MIPMLGGTLSAQALDPDHYEALDKALSHLLSTQIARESLSQLMDGLPVWSVYRQNFSHINIIDAPIRQHLELCEGAQEMADAFIAKFSTAALLFDPAVSVVKCHVSPQEALLTLAQGAANVPGHHCRYSAI